ncbi:MAG: LLM class flavin-dependent oxidoreductase [Acidimicrobiaceae bacterium]|nr:LLM class flavin-dependent oxidoreductase [Acidimicrobiaceae bacterium]MBO0748222.1 LLM class flavin-dependent oxidoreductase [Acidimicrobiaceae bacterium]
MALARPVPLSILELSPIPVGGSAGVALRNSIDLARHADAWGYRRMWVAEHHNSPGVASAVPAILIGHLAEATTRLRVGSGGVMLPNHAPLAIAEQFGMLESLHPGRIDLGIGRAPGTDPLTARALRRFAEAGADDFPQQFAELRAFFEDSFPDGHPYQEVHAIPAKGATPAIWLLGSSGYSAQVAGILGLPFAFAHHFSSENTLPALDLYRNCFEPSEVLDEPYAMVGVAVVVADTEAEARFQHGSSRLSMLRLRTGRRGQLPSPEEAAEYQLTPREKLIVASATGSHVVGDPAQVAAGLDDLLDRTGADELIVTTTMYRHEDRLHSFELLAQVADLGAGLTEAAAAGP